MTKKCEYCQNMYPDNLSACPVCGSTKFIDLGKIEAEQKRIERKAKVKYSAKFVIVGIILWLVLYFTILSLTILLAPGIHGLLANIVWVVIFLYYPLLPYTWDSESLTN